MKDDSRTPTPVKSYTLWERRSLRRLAALSRGPRILDIGCFLRENPYLKGTIIGLDIVDRECPANYTQFVHGDMNTLPKYFDAQTFDSVIFGFVIGYANDVTAVVKDGVGLLKPGGVLAISWLNPFRPTNLVSYALGRPEHGGSANWIVSPLPGDMMRIMESAGLSEVGMHLGAGLFSPRFEIPIPARWSSISIYRGEKR